MATKRKSKKRRSSTATKATKLRNHLKASGLRMPHGYDLVIRKRTKKKK